VIIRSFQQDDRIRWDEFVLQSPTAALSHHINWKSVIEDSFGHDTHYWLAEDGGGRVTGILPLVHMKSCLFGNFMVSVPYLNAGGICAEDADTHRALLDAAIDLARRKNVEHVELRYDHSAAVSLPSKTSKVAMRLDLPVSSDDLWQGFNGKLRSQIRRPMKDGMLARIGKMDELESFYSVFSHNMRDLGTPVYSKHFFMNILKTFPETTWICTVYRNDIPVASGLLAGFKHILEIPWASSLSRFRRSSPNMLLYWTCLKFACEQGYRTFDFGRSTRDGGTYNFKEQWGAQPIQLCWYYWLRESRPLPEINPSNHKYKFSIRIWQRLPVRLTNLIGPMIVRNIP